MFDLSSQPQVWVNLSMDSSRFQHSLESIAGGDAGPLTLEMLEQTIREIRERTVTAVHTAMAELITLGRTELPNGTVMILSGRSVLVRRPDGDVGAFWVGTGVHDDTRPVVPVELDQCWRCTRAVPKDDDLGLCVECKTALQTLTDEPTPIAPTYEQEYGNELGTLPTDSVDSIEYAWPDILGNHIHTDGGPSDG